MSSQQTVLDIENVSISYGPVRAVKDISLSVTAGETFGLIGLNGAGKTTLIKTVLGLRPQDTGAIRLFAKPVHDIAARRRMAFLPERFDPAWFLTGMEFIKFSLQMYGQVFNQDQVLENVRKVALDPAALSRRVQTYSKGMRQKLGLLGTILTGCDLMILDEPMSGLDPLARARVKDMLLACKKQNRTVFLSSHILSDLEEICDRVAVIHEGVLRFTGDPAALKKAGNAENLERAFLHFIEKKEAA
ncbi:MAG: ABC transporter ATP-binding protein [Alphaproteobacteria bacterium]|nr:ABC transporter ATP-binding protein [Alphaproteobacteria bacterium]